MTTFFYFFFLSCSELCNEGRKRERESGQAVRERTPNNALFAALNPRLKKFMTSYGRFVSVSFFPRCPSRRPSVVTDYSFKISDEDDFLA